MRRDKPIIVKSSEPATPTSAVENRERGAMEENRLGLEFAFGGWRHSTCQLQRPNQLSSTAGTTAVPGHQVLRPDRPKG